MYAILYVCQTRTRTGVFTYSLYNRGYMTSFGHAYYDSFVTKKIPRMSKQVIHELRYT